VTVDEYYAWFSACGYEPTGQGTLITLEMRNSSGSILMVTRPEELSAQDRSAAIERYKMYLGVGYPPHGHGVH